MTTSLFSLSNFRNYFIFFLVFISFTFHSFILVFKYNKNDTITSENYMLLFIVICLISLLFKQLISISNTSESIYFIGFLSSIFLLQIIINFTIEYFLNVPSKKKDSFSYNFENEITKTVSSIGSSLIIGGISLYILPKYIQNFQQISGVFDNIMNENFYYYVTFFIFFILYKIIFTLNYSNSIKSSVMLPTLLGIPVFLTIFVFLLFLGKSLKIINWKNYLTTFVVLSILISLFVYVWLYIFMDNVNDICKNKKSQEQIDRDNSLIGKYLPYFLIIAIIIMLWIIDSRKWNRMECILYVIITLILFTSYTTLSTDYPKSSLLVFWLTIEWFLVTYYNWLNVKGSFHCIFANHDS